MSCGAREPPFGHHVACGDSVKIPGRMQVFPNFPASADIAQRVVGLVSSLGVIQWAI